MPAPPFPSSAYDYGQRIVILSLPCLAWLADRYREPNFQLTAKVSGLLSS